MSEMMSAYTVEEAMEVAQEAPAKPAKASKHATGKRARANRGKHPACCWLPTSPLLSSCILLRGFRTPELGRAILILL